jgi:L,D-transpeptidase ErfK/SrfK
MINTVRWPTVISLVVWVLLLGGTALGGGFRYQFPARNNSIDEVVTVVGFLQHHTVKEEETLLDIARKYGLGFNEIHLFYPDTDPWLPEAGSNLVIPTHWILPRTKRGGLVINIPEMRIYQFFPKSNMVKTYPVGIGVFDWETPEGAYRIAARETNPTWVVPKSLREKYGVRRVPPGPENPLGSYWLGLSRRGYGIHGTNFPWGVGRLVSHGCIRLYPEHIEQLFHEVTVGTPVEIIYEPVKVGLNRRAIFIEIHPDIYVKEDDPQYLAKDRLQQAGLLDHVFPENLTKALQLRNGVPMYIGYVSKGGDGLSAWNGGKGLAALRDIPLRLTRR